MTIGYVLAFQASLLAFDQHLSVTVLFRVLTYWLRIPIGWASMRFLQRQGEL